MSEDIFVRRRVEIQFRSILKRTSKLARRRDRCVMWRDTVAFPTIVKACDDYFVMRRKRRPAGHWRTTMKKKWSGRSTSSRRWKRPLHAVLNTSKLKNGLGWLRISMYTNKNKESTASAEHFGEHFEKLGIKGINRDNVRAMVEY